MENARDRSDVVGGYEYLLDGADNQHLSRPRVTFSHLALPGEDSTLCGLPRAGLLLVDEPGATISCLRCDRKRASTPD